MRYRATLLAAFVSSVALCLSPAAHAAGTASRPCDSIFDLPGAKCGTVKVPIDRTGKVAGSVDLFYERLPAKKQSKSTIVIFPGGPGAATSILGYDVLPIVRKSMVDHDVLLFDQRGTGRSDYLDCDTELEAGASDFLLGDTTRAVGKGVQRCARKIGAKRAFYTTRDTVADTEDLRAALGIDKLVLVGVSYGTLDAMGYARA